MKVIEIKGNKYKIMFGYKSLYKSGILRKLQDAQDIFSDKSEEGAFDKIEKLMDVTAEAFLVGLQKFHKDKFGYDTLEEKNEKLDKICDLFDDYAEEDESVGVLEIFSIINEELTEQGFLAKLFKSTQEILSQQDVTIIPEDHKKIAKK